MEPKKVNQAQKKHLPNWTSKQKVQKKQQDDATTLVDRTPIPEHKGAAKLINWEGDSPVPTTERVLTQENVQDLIACAASLPYTQEDDKYDTYPELYGMTYLEVALIKAAQQAAKGDTGVLTLILDRLIGKPKQSIEKKTLSMTYQDLLDNINNSTPISTSSPTTIDAKVIDDGGSLDI